eukprot:CCRYP_001510-RA/>CCRYP_001510-RA protein AED:0.13 eAED:1.00 QI:0/-1/0/1/-1/0/1/0/65
MMLVSCNIMQTMGILQTMHSSNTTISKDNQLLNVESMHTSIMAEWHWRKSNQGHLRSRKNNVAAC